MKRLLLSAAGLLLLARAFWPTGNAEAQFSWSPTKTPTRTRTRTPTRTPSPTPTPPGAPPPGASPTPGATPAATSTPAPTPRPPIPTVPPAEADLTVDIASCIRGAASRRLPGAKVVVVAGGQTYEIRPNPVPGRCWLTPEGAAVSLGRGPFLVRWTLGNAVEEMEGQDGVPVVLRTSGYYPASSTARRPTVLTAEFPRPVPQPAGTWARRQHTGATP